MIKVKINKVNLFRLIGIISIIILIMHGIKRNTLLRSEGIYTIGKIVEIGPGAKSNVNLTYIFNFKSETFKSTYPISFSNDLDVQKGETYLVQFLKNNPNESKILTSKPVVVELGEAPDSGYLEIPIHILR